jgi:hypothetical protein
MTWQPRRWSGSELPDELNAALSSADADASEQAIERMRSRLSDALGPAFADIPPPMDAGKAQRAVRLLSPGKWLGIGALFAIGFGAFWIRGPGAPAGHAEHAAKDHAAGAPAGAGAVHGSLPEAPAGVPLQPPITPSAPVSQPMAATNEQPEPLPAARPVKRAGQQVKGPELGLAEELRQLEQIRKRLRVSPARALVEADTHARRFPHGTLGPERELLRVDALLRLGRNPEAHKLAEQMLAAPEGHPYRAQIEQLLSAP